MTIDVGAAIELSPRDTVILATDGLTDNVHIDEIVELTRKGPLDEAADVVVAKAVERMSHFRHGQPSKPDDLSLIVFRKPHVSYAT